MVEFICYPKCTTCQKAKKWLDDNKIEYELRDIKEQNPNFEELSLWYERSGLPLKKFFNTSGLLYKSMELKTKLPGMSDEDQLKLLASDGMLVKRPIIVGDDFVLVGFKEGEWVRNFWGSGFQKLTFSFLCNQQTTGFHLMEILPNVGTEMRLFPGYFPGILKKTDSGYSFAYDADFHFLTVWFLKAGYSTLLVITEKSSNSKINTLPCTLIIYNSTNLNLSNISKI